MVDISRALRTAAKTGSVQFGYKETSDAVSDEEAEAVILARNMPDKHREGVLEAADEHRVPIVEFPGTNVELGPALGEPFSVSAAAILDPGESDILEAAKRSA
ncbi:50S ribosomal protein L30e [Thermoplasmatales archaeon SW_10_69_26]|jgi:large subunit ribosomal protein L30e|nr:MAG: 50S ribosomal protein L30e [Thermoplasmatales archaeon SW_10_69_26]